MCLQENSTFCFRPFEVGAGFSKTREQQQKWPEQGPEGVESKLFWLCWTGRRHAEGSTPGGCLSVWITAVVEGRAFELVVLVGKSYYTGRRVEELQKGGTAWKGLGSNGAHAGNGEVREGGTVTDRR